MIVAAHQPNFLPNLGFFYKMKQADLFVIISNIQFEKQEGWQQRHKIPGPQGDIWLTIPVKGSQNDKIKDILIDNTKNWKKKHIKTLKILYAKTSEKKLLDQLIAIYSEPYERLVDFNFALLHFLRDVVGVTTPLVLDEEVTGDKHQLLINICKKYNADTYLSGKGAVSYMTETYFDEMERNNIGHIFVEKNITAAYPYTAVHYLLTQGKETISNLLKEV